MLLLKFKISLVLAIIFSFNLNAQVKILDKFDAIDQTSGKSAPSLNEGILTVLYSKQQEQETSYTSILELDNSLNEINSFKLPFNEFPFAVIYNIDVYDEDNYLILLETDDSDMPIDRLDKKLFVMILRKDFTWYDLIEIYDWNSGFQLYNSSMVKLSNQIVRYYFSVSNIEIGSGFELNYFDFDLTTNTVFNQSTSEINPNLIYRDTKLVDSLLYFSSLTGFHHRSIDEEETQNYNLSWNNGAGYFHSMGDLHFEILSNRKLILSGFHNYQFNEFPSNHAIAVYNLDNLITMYSQDPPDLLYTTEVEMRSRSWARSITKIPGTDEVWVYGANVNLLDVFFYLPDRNTTLYLTKLDSEGELEFTVDVDMDGYAFPHDCTSDKDGNVYASGFIIKVNDEEHTKGFIVKVNRNGELSEIIETPLDKNISVYPNPVVGNISINGVSDGQYKIITIQGKTIDTGTFSGGQVPTASLPAGPYVLILEYDGQMSVQKVLKQE